MTHILGISAYYHDSAACLLKEGKIVAAAQEERFTRKKHDPRFPSEAIAYCLREGGITPKDLDIVAFYDKPLLTFERLLLSYLATAPSGFRSFRQAIPLWIKGKLWTKDNIREGLKGYEGKILFTEHHISHAASAFYPSPFETSAVLTMDGVGEWATSSIGVGEGNSLRLLKELHFPHSLGLLYSAFTYYTGFKVNSGEYKVMGLAPYGEPTFVKKIYENLIDLKADGSFKLNMDYFDFVSGLTMTNDRFAGLFGGPARAPESKLSQREMDLARSVQDVAEEIMIRMARHACDVAGSKNLCLAGGVALNCVGNGRILREGIVDRMWIQPAAGDAGGALGAASFAWHDYLGKPRSVDGKKDSQSSSLLGPAYSEDEIGLFLQKKGIGYERLDVEKVAEYLDTGAVIGWFQGRMEYGPRALGARSIIGDPRNPEMQSKMNLKIKFRESFRPFAPAVLREDVGEWFEMECDSPYMLLVAPVQKSKRRAESEGDKKRWGIERLNLPRSEISAVTHVDYSARVQTVPVEGDHPFRAILQAFKKRTGCPVLVNTSFNVRGEPIVCRPEEAYACFMRTRMDYLVLGNYVLDKKAQPEADADDPWKEEFALD